MTMTTFLDGAQWGTLPDWVAVAIALLGVAVAAISVIVTAAAFTGAAIAAFFTFRQARAAERQVAIANDQLDVARQVRDDAIAATARADAALARREGIDRHRYELSYANTVDLRAPILTWETAKTLTGSTAEYAGGVFYDNDTDFDTSPPESTASRSISIRVRDGGKGFGRSTLTRKRHGDA